MEFSKIREILLLTVLLAAGLTGAALLGDRLVAAKPSLPESYEDEDLSLQGEKLKGYAFGFEGLIADWYWMRSLQYIGGKFVKASDRTISLDDLKPLNPRLLYPLLDNATTLDPNFLTVYYYGAIVLPAIDPKEAIAIAEKGIRNNPSEWRLYHYLGFIHWRLGEYSKAAEVYEKGSRIEGAPPFMTLMVAKLKSDAGSRDTAREIYRQVYEQARDSQSKRNAELRLLQLDSLDERDAIGEAISEFREANGRCPSGWRELLPILSRKEIPGDRDFRIDKEGRVVDPTDAPYLLTSEGGECAVALDKERTAIPLK